MSDRFLVILSSSRGHELCGGTITRALAIEVAQRVLMDVAEGEKWHEFLDGDTIAIEIRDVGG